MAAQNAELGEYIYFFYYLLGLREFVRTTQIDWTFHNFLLKSFNSPQWLLVCEGIYKVFGLKSKTLFLQLLFYFAFQGIVPLSCLHCPVVGLSLVSKRIWWLNSSVQQLTIYLLPRGLGCSLLLIGSSFLESIWKIVHCFPTSSILILKLEYKLWLENKVVYTLDFSISQFFSSLTTEIDLVHLSFFSVFGIHFYSEKKYLLN